MSSWAPTVYQTGNWPLYKTALKRRGSMSIWFDPEMVWVLPLDGRHRRQLSFGDAGIQSCLALEVLLEIPLRQTMPSSVRSVSETRVR